MWASYNGFSPRVPQLRPKCENLHPKRDNENPHPFTMHVPLPRAIYLKSCQKLKAVPKVEGPVTKRWSCSKKGHNKHFKSVPFTIWRSTTKRRHVRSKQLRSRFIKLRVEKGKFDDENWVGLTRLRKNWLYGPEKCPGLSRIQTAVLWLLKYQFSR